MRKVSLVPLALLVVLAVAACQSAHPAASTSAAATTVTGKVVSFTGDKVEVETASGHQTLVIDANTHGREQLMVGAHLAFAVERRSGGAPVATRITAAPAKPAAH